MIDETGAFLLDSDEFYLSDSVYISAADIRKFQLAKGAVRAGIEILLAIAAREGQAVEALFLCGGLGNYIRIDSAVKTGLIPEQLADKVRPCGNAAGVGAAMCLVNNSVMKRAEEISKNTTEVELAANPQFADLFTEHMFFPYE
ncbi:MAG: ATP-binding protein [Clostridiales bacterium]|nr:ATP-binding protein [Clostridiales bacterium]